MSAIDMIVGAKPLSYKKKHFHTKRLIQIEKISIWNTFFLVKYRNSTITLDDLLNELLGIIRIKASRFQDYAFMIP